MSATAKNRWHLRRFLFVGYLALFLLPGFWMAMMAIVGGLVLPGRRRRLASGSLSALTLLLPFVLDASPIEDHVLRYAGCAIVFALLCVAVLFLTTVRQPLGVRRWLSAPFPIVLAVSMVAGRTPVDASTLVALAILAAYAVGRRFFLERYEHPVPETPEIVVGGPRG